MISTPTGDWEANTRLPAPNRELFDEPRTVTAYGVTLVDHPTDTLTEDNSYVCYYSEEDRDVAAKNFLEDGYTLKYEEPFDVNYQTIYDTTK